MLTYRISTGELLDSLSNCLGIGYSGTPAALNNPSDVAIPNVGPIPPGQYRIGSPIDTASHGPYVLPLTPSEGDETFGRSGFLIHGDSASHPGAASHGCIILARPIREQIWALGDHDLLVVR